jgi:wobble nucleotide-excising tRNase
MNDDLEIMWDKIKTQRDELRVRSHLAKAEFRDEWQELELKWETAEKNLNHLQKEAKETTEDVKTSAKIVLDELSSAYDRIKDRLKD